MWTCISATCGTTTPPIEEILEGLHRVIRAGKARYAGISNCFAWQLAKANAIAEYHGWEPFITVQGHYNLIFREEEREMAPPVPGGKHRPDPLQRPGRRPAGPPPRGALPPPGGRRLCQGQVRRHEGCGRDYYRPGGRAGPAPGGVHDGPSPWPGCSLRRPPPWWAAPSSATLTARWRRWRPPSPRKRLPGWRSPMCPTPWWGVMAGNRG